MSWFTSFPSNNQLADGVCLFVFKNHRELMNLNLFNMIRSIAGVIFTDVQIVQSLGIWSVFKLALKFF